MNFLLICWRLVSGWLRGHEHHYTLLKWDNQEQCLYVQCWECGARSYGNFEVEKGLDDAETD